jgi:superfamily I DNA/RNA helicase
VRTADSIAYRLVSGSVKSRITPAGDDALRRLLQEARSRTQIEGNPAVRRRQLSTLERLSEDYLLEEITTVIQARALTSLADYLTTPRAGRRVPLTEVQRGAIWRVYETFERLRERRGLWTWAAIRRRAAELIQMNGTSEKYDAVVVDEAQDLDATVLRMSVGLSASPESIFVTADANQSIYGSGFRWVDVHADLRFKGRTGVLRKNYRTTREIGEGTQAYLQGGTLDDELVDREYTQSGGLMPVTRTVSAVNAEAELLDAFLRLASRDARQGLGGCAVLVPSENAGRAIAERLRNRGVAATFMAGRELDLERPVVKVITQQSAKGLEFPVVAIGGFLDTPLYPGAPQGEAGERDELQAKQRRVLFVGMTRAMRGLLVAVPVSATSPVFLGMDEPYWNRG